MLLQANWLFIANSKIPVMTAMEATYLAANSAQVKAALLVAGMEVNLYFLVEFMSVYMDIMVIKPAKSTIVDVGRRMSINLNQTIGWIGAQMIVLPLQMAGVVFVLAPVLLEKMDEK